MTIVNALSNQLSTRSLDDANCFFRVQWGLNSKLFTLRRLLTNVKDKDEPEDRPKAVYKIKCCDCQATYMGETGRNVTTRLNENKRATKKGDLNNNIAEHLLKISHTIDWNSATCLTYSTDYYQRITLENWFRTNRPRSL